MAQGGSLQRPPLHGVSGPLYNYTLSLTLGIHIHNHVHRSLMLACSRRWTRICNAPSFAGFTWGKENNALNASQARACDLQATAFNQSYNEEPYLAPYQPSLPSTSSLQYAHSPPIHTNASFPLPLSQRVFEQDTLGLRNCSAEATTLSDGLGLGTSSSCACLHSFYSPSTDFKGRS